MGGGGARRRGKCLPIFFLPKNIFVATETKSGKSKIVVRVGERAERTS
jgi:hypothetical protein